MSERWAPIPDFPGYDASDAGRIRSWLDFQGRRRAEPRVLRTTGPAGGGHQHLTVYRGRRPFTRSVHRLVLEAFVGPCPDGMEACHYPDRDPRNNRLENLRWDTRKANFADRDEHGTTARGSTHGNAVLDEARVQRILRRFEDGVPQASLAREERVSKSLVSQICTRKIWRHVS